MTGYHRRMASAVDKPKVPAPNAAAVLAAAIDHAGRHSTASDALDRLRGDAPQSERTPHAAAG